MDRDHAARLAARIIAATGIWTAEAAVELTREIEAWRDTECAEAAADAIARGWVDRNRPSLGVVIQAYNNAITLKRRREEELLRSLDPDYAAVDPAVGREIAYEAYCNTLSLPMNPETRERFFTWGAGSWAVFAERRAPDDEIDMALAAVGDGVMYPKVVDAFKGDHLRTGRALRTLEKSGRIVHRNNGWITPRAH